MEPSPLVTVIIRSKASQTLDLTLRSVAGQSYPDIELIIVDTTAGRHPPLAPVLSQSGHTTRLVSSEHRLAPSQAANLGLDLATGEFFCCLDDDGSSFPPEHISGLVEAAHNHPEAVLTYTRATLPGSDHPVEKLLGRPYNRALVHYVPMLFLPAALIRRRVIDQGCRFDEALELCEDRDFLIQVSLHGNLVFLPDNPPVLNVRPESGHSNSGQADIDTKSRRRYFESIFRARWTGERHYHARRATWFGKRAFQEYDSGRIELARASFEQVLREYPGDPDALFGLARIELQAGHAEAALGRILGAIDIHPNSAEYQYTAGLIQQRLGNVEEARRAAASAMGDPAFRPAAGKLLAQLPLPAAATPSDTSSATAADAQNKDAATDAKSHAADLVIQSARDLLLKGEAEQASALLEQLKPEEVNSPGMAQLAGQMCLYLNRLQSAQALLDHAYASSVNKQPQPAYDKCRNLMLREAIWHSAGRKVCAILDGLNAASSRRVKRTAVQPVHIVCQLNAIGGTERQALNLFRILSARQPVNLWSTVPAHPDYSAEFPIRSITKIDAPAQGTLILVGAYPNYGNWLETAAFDRIIITHTLIEEYPSLMLRLIQIEANQSHPQVGLTLPSRLFQQSAGLSGQVEYPPVDAGMFKRRKSRANAASLVIGRHGRDHYGKFHPNDPAFMRTLMRLGHKVRILGGTNIAPAFAGEAGLDLQLLPIGAEPARDFLESLDLFIYRKHPDFLEAGGTAILEAMMMALPVIVFREHCGAAELIVHGVNGYLVDSESEAISCVNSLSADVALRERIGTAAHDTIVALMRQQDQAIVEFYLGPI